MFDSRRNGDSSASRLPSLKERSAFASASSLLDLRSRRARFYYCTTPASGSVAACSSKWTSHRQRARRSGSIRDQFIRYPSFVGEWLSFVSTRMNVGSPCARRDGSLRRLHRRLDRSRASHCGKRSDRRSRVVDGGVVIERIDRVGAADPRFDGRADRIDSGMLARWATSGSTSQRTSMPVIKRCDDSGCRVLGRRSACGLVGFARREAARLRYVRHAGAAGRVDDRRRRRRARGRRFGDGVRDRLGIEPDPVGVATARRARSSGPRWTSTPGRRPDGSVPGTRDCSDGSADPLSPVDPDLRVISNRRVAAEVAAARST